MEYYLTYNFDYMDYSIVKKSNWFSVNDTDINNLFTIWLPKKIFEDIFVGLYIRSDSDFFINWYLNPEKTKESLFIDFDKLLYSIDYWIKEVNKSFDKTIKHKEQLEMLINNITEYENKKITESEVKNILWDSDYIDKKSFNVATNTNDHILEIKKAFQKNLKQTNNNLSVLYDEIDKLKIKKENLINEFEDKTLWNHILFKVHIEDLWEDSFKITYPDWR